MSIVFYTFMPVIFASERTGAKQSPLTDQNRVIMVNHRGANDLAPENTYASAKKAIACGVTYVEVDVRRSKDGIYYNFHDERLERTTNGTGLLAETLSSVMDTLDAGSWFGHEFSGEKVPRLYEYLKWIKGRAKVYFDMKDVDLGEFVSKIYELGMDKDCFFWFSDDQLARKFRKMYPTLALKINANTPGSLDTIVAAYNPQIIECSVSDLTDEFIQSCHKKNLKIMPWIPDCNLESFREAIKKGVDMVNLNYPDVFSNLVKNDGVYKGYKLIAHRGGIVGKQFGEYDPASIKEAINQGYYMLEVDVRETKDGVLMLCHDDNYMRSFNDPHRINELSWDEAKKLKSIKGNYRPLSFEELALMCSGKIKLMIDIKENNPQPEFYHKLEKIMDQYKLFEGSYFIDPNARNYFWGKTKFSARINEVASLREKYERGEDIASNYFLFDAGTRLNSSVIKQCQVAHVAVIASVNLEHYKLENPIFGAKRDIEFLKECGVTEFQIDSDYDPWLPIEK